MPNELTPKLLEGLRAAQRNAPTIGGQQINLVTSKTLGLLLDAAEALLQIRTIAREETDLGDFAKRVDAVLAGLERGR